MDQVHHKPHYSAAKHHDLFTNDGNFMERFKQQMEAAQNASMTCNSQHHSNIRGRQSNNSEGVDTRPPPGSATKASCRAGSEMKQGSEIEQTISFTARTTDNQQSRPGPYSRPNSEAKHQGQLQAKRHTSLPFIGKRRGKTPALKTGAVVKKTNKDKEESTGAATDAWAMYMAEVKRYTSNTCQEEDRSRPLVK